MSVVVACRMFRLVVLWCVISGGRGQHDNDEENNEIAAAQLFELQRLATDRNVNEAVAGKMAKQYFEISAGNPFFQAKLPMRMEKERAQYEINPENPFLQQFLGPRGHVEVTASTTGRPVSRITTTTPSTTTYRHIPGLTLYLSPSIEETRKKQVGGPIIGSFLPKAKANVVNVFQRFGAPDTERTQEEPPLSDAEIEDLFGSYEAMRLAPKLFVPQGQ